MKVGIDLSTLTFFAWLRNALVEFDQHGLGVSSADSPVFHGQHMGNRPQEPMLVAMSQRSAGEQWANKAPSFKGQILYTISKPPKNRV